MITLQITEVTYYLGKMCLIKCSNLLFVLIFYYWYAQKTSVKGRKFKQKQVFHEGPVRAGSRVSPLQRYFLSVKERNSAWEIAFVHALTRIDK